MSWAFITKSPLLNGAVNRSKRQYIQQALTKNGVLTFQGNIINISGYGSKTAFWKRLPCSSSSFSSLQSTETNNDEVPSITKPRNKTTNVRNENKKRTRFRQHVNPLSRNFQAPVQLPDKWIEKAFYDSSLPLYLDIGCGKGGFLLDLATHAQKESTTASSQSTSIENDCDPYNHRFDLNIANDKMNYLGLEIRPDVAEYAQNRVSKSQWNLDGKVYFIQCNANVDLDRILKDYTNFNSGKLQMVSIQYPDPHFKAQHKKRRVVNPDLIRTLAKYMENETVVFLQSDVKEVLDDMREQFREFPEYFLDQISNIEEYIPTNPLGVPTEREISVLKQDLPVYRVLFKRTDKSVDSSKDDDSL